VSVDVLNALLWKAARAVSLLSGGTCRIQRYYFVAQPVSASALVAESSGRAIVIRRVDADDPLVAQFPRPQEVIAVRFRMGAVCFAAEREGQFIGFAWLKEDQYSEDEVRCLFLLDPVEHAAWDFDVYIDPAFRFGRTFARLWDHVNQWLRERGYRWSLSRISAFNADSLAAHRRLGMRSIGSATFVCVRTVQLTLVGQAPFVHLGWRRDDVPTLRLRAPRYD
jgi:GNAT superfamily N-acetyltransferase